MRSLALLSNPDSGSGQPNELPGKLRALGAEVREFEIGEFDEAAGSGAERLVVAGGDGSIAPAARAAGRHGVPLAVLPTGTGNDFARTHRLPLEVDGACSLAVEGERLQPIDIATMNGRPFLNVASLGLAPAAAERAHGLKGVLGPLAYAVGSIGAGLATPATSCRVRCDEEEWFQGEVWQLTVACSGGFGGGSGVDADAADGRLDVVVIEAGSRILLPTYAYSLRRRSIEGRRGVRKRRCHSLRIEAPAGTGFNIDGELVEAGDSRFGVEPRAVELISG